MTVMHCPDIYALIERPQAGQEINMHPVPVFHVFTKDHTEGDGDPGGGGGHLGI